MEIEDQLAEVAADAARATGDSSGFMMIVCKSADDDAVRNMLESAPPNDRARFFDFDVSREGLIVNVC